MNIMYKKVNKIWRNESNNMTYYDGSNSFQIIFDLNQRMSIQATVPFTPKSVTVFVNIKYG
jgi:hypothetical protein